jgi:hypothetical protein
MSTNLLTSPNALMAPIEFVGHGCWIHWLVADKDGQVESISYLLAHAVAVLEG